MKKVTKAVAMFVYRFSGLQYVVNEIESFVFRYKLRLRMVPVSYKLFLLTLGVIIGGSSVYVRYEYSASLTPEKWEYENPAINTVQAEDIEVKELTIEEKIAKTFPENPTLMIAVAKAESGLDPMETNRNTNGTRDIGILMVNSVHGHDDLEMFDVDKNLAAAREVYDKQGITAWSAFNNGSYKKFMQ